VGHDSIVQKLVADTRQIHWLTFVPRGSGVVPRLVFCSFLYEHSDDGDHICQLVTVIARLDVGVEPALQPRRSLGGADVALLIWHLLLHIRFLTLTCRIFPYAERLQRGQHLETL